MKRKSSMATLGIVLAAVCPLVAIAAAPPASPARELGPLIQGLVEEFKKEQQAADAALGAAFSREAVSLVKARLDVVEKQATGELSELADQIGKLIERRFSELEPAKNAQRNQQLSADVLAAVAEVKAGLQGLDSRTRSQLQAEIANLGRGYVTRHNKEMATRVGVYVNRLKALIRAQADQSAAQIRAAIRKAAAEFSARIARGARPSRRGPAPIRPTRPSASPGP